MNHYRKVKLHFFNHPPCSGNLWANDENKFGHKLMEKMGWEKGKGLGANQDGMVTHVKVRQKDNQKGVGYAQIYPKLMAIRG